jgi:hypothetical protein
MGRRLPEVAFDILLRAARGAAGASIETIDAFRPDPHAVEWVRRWLSERGVVCHATHHGLACSAPGEVIARLFTVKVRRNPARGPEQRAVEILGEVQVPAEIADLVEQVTFPAPPQLFS